MAIENGDFVKFNFTGKVKETGEIIDTTYEEVAKEADLYDENKIYEPVTIIVGANHLFKAMDDAFVEYKVGDKKTIELAPEDAFGERDSSLIKLLPMKDFKKQDIKPFPGMIITSQGQNGKVLTVNGGRVRVDFNNPFAGKDLIYDVEILEVIEDDVEKVKSIIKLRYNYQSMDIDNIKIDIADKICEIQFEEISRFVSTPHAEVSMAKAYVAMDIWNYMDIDNVRFVDEFKKKDIKEDNDEEKEE